MKKKRNKVFLKLERLTRLLMIYTLSGIMPLYIVTEYPRSGGSWFCQMLSEYLELPFPRHEFPKIQSSVMQGHYLYFPTMRNVVVVLRDGRDTMVSYYHFRIFRYPDEFRHRHDFTDYENIRENMPEFIEYMFTRSRTPRFTWSEFVNSWINKDVVFVRYEDLLDNTPKALGEVIKKLQDEEPDYSKLEKIYQKYSFETQSGRNRGAEEKSSNIRKGISGDWKNYFSPYARQVFHHYAGDILIKLGYEKDDSWLSE